MLKSKRVGLFAYLLVLGIKDMVFIFPKKAKSFRRSWLGFHHIPSGRPFIFRLLLLVAWAFLLAIGFGGRGGESVRVIATDRGNDGSLSE